MPQYYFDLRDGDVLVKDDDGVELLDVADAQMEAASFLADMAQDLAMRAPNVRGYPMSVEVRDAEGPLFVISFGFLRGDLRL
jgi:hypothetical protein